jgi:hypothetical protein
MARREEGEYATYSTDEQRRQLNSPASAYNNGIWMVVNALHWMIEAPGLSALRPRTPADAGAKPSPEN